VDLASRQVSSFTAIRGISSFVAVADGVNLASLAAEITANLITIGDKSTLIVVPLHTATTGAVYVTPIVFNAAGTALSIRTTKSSSMGTALFVSAGVYYSPQLIWDTQGAVKIGLHITSISAGNTVKLLAGLI
jgi:hypothetical protein